MTMCLQMTNHLMIPVNQQTQGWLHESNTFSQIRSHHLHGKQDSVTLRGYILMINSQLTSGSKWQTQSPYLCARYKSLEIVPHPKLIVQSERVETKSVKYGCTKYLKEENISNISRQAFVPSRDNNLTFANPISCIYDVVCPKPYNTTYTSK